jgi:hypothetical protein
LSDTANVVFTDHEHPALRNFLVKLTRLQSGFPHRPVYHFIDGEYDIGNQVKKAEGKT